MIAVFLRAALAGLMLTGMSEAASAYCRGGSFNIKEQQRIRVERRVRPGSFCQHTFTMRDLSVSGISTVRRPTQGRIQPARTGRGAYEYQSNPGASGTDSYVIRADFDRINQQSGQVTGKTWLEVEFVVRFSR
jgi:hypothetical protein